jgi:hypothetical protein
VRKLQTIYVLLDESGRFAPTPCRGILFHSFKVNAIIKRETNFVAQKIALNPPK